MHLDLKCPTEILNKLHTDHRANLKQKLLGTDYEKMNGIVALMFVYKEVFMLLETMRLAKGIKASKILREEICQRIHAFPLDEKESNDIH